MGKIVEFPKQPCISCGNRSLNCVDMCSTYKDYKKIFLDDECAEIENRCYEHKGYVLQQSLYNFHYMILKKDSGKMVMHVQYDKKLNKGEAEKCIEDYIKILKEI